jgi:hypothetical protein
MTDQAKEISKNVTGEQPRKRIPLGTRNILTAPKKNGFVRRFVNDKGDRIQSFKDASWTVVDENVPVGDDKIGRASTLGSLANPHVGGGQRAILMEIPEEIYNEDRAASQAKITKVENEIKRNSKPDASAESFGTVSIS